MSTSELPKNIELDGEGYFKNGQQWTPELAPVIAAKEGIELSDDHWKVVDYVRRFYEEFDTSPSIRPLVKYLAKNWGEEKGNSLYLYKLFPKGPAKQATKIAGLPKPKRCI
ncbi:TusE/DsrC/DsvC family sulfur relay protein [Pleionea litopenaei]|uniref:Sulfurtransferase n=1 Tax=Pleionea litopenaei TaxID=3070815 RepID=A0AA51RV41_9GAMM|nr:TusE/DsrC/DsvC family sulfur relay protein [Pleionea sp. HL-JVS1]WMS88085.1 TusE/DsrC/DsvC family sulfur relay protein [Pleionea sp. HL-JVS1]